MKLIRLAALAAFFAVYAIAQTTISDTVYYTPGKLWRGDVTVTWSAFTTADGHAVAAGSTQFSVSSGALYVKLYPNVGGAPGIAYAAHYYTTLAGSAYGVTWDETWANVVSSPSTITLATARTWSSLSGNMTLHGTGIPGNSIGANGDFYLDTAATCLYGPKASNAWPGICTSLIGPAGPIAGTNGQYVFNNNGVAGGKTPNAPNGPAQLDASGNLPIGSTVLDPGPEGSCALSLRGHVVTTNGGAGVADTRRVCTKAADGTYSWQALGAGSSAGGGALTPTALGNISGAVSLPVGNTPQQFTGTLVGDVTLTVTGAVTGPGSPIFAIDFSTGTGGHKLTLDATFAGGGPMTTQAGVTCYQAFTWNGTIAPPLGGNMTCPGATPAITTPTGDLTLPAAPGAIPSLASPGTFTNKVMELVASNTVTLAGTPFTGKTGNTGLIVTANGSKTAGSTACYDANGNLDTAACGGTGITPTTLHITENFINKTNGSVPASGIGSYGWQWIGSGSSVATDSAQNILVNNVQVVTGAVSGNVATLLLGQQNVNAKSIPDIGSTTNWSAALIFRVSDLTLSRQGVGISGAISGDMLTAGGNHGVGVFCDPSNTLHDFYFFVTANDNLQATADSGVPCTTTDVWRLHMSSTTLGVVSLQMYKNGAAQGSPVLAGTGQALNKAIPSGGSFAPIFHATTLENASHFITAHYFEYLITGLAQ